MSTTSIPRNNTHTHTSKGGGTEIEILVSTCPHRGPCKQYVLYVYYPMVCEDGVHCLMVYSPEQVHQSSLPGNGRFDPVGKLSGILPLLWSREIRGGKLTLAAYRNSIGH